MTRRRMIWIVASVILVVAFATASAQDACVALVQQALLAVDENCTGLQRNSACYGFNRVDASFVMEVEDDFFTIPSDRTNIGDLEEIATAGLDTTLEQWGVAVMSVQANVPDALPGQNVSFMLVGDVEVENAVDPEEAVQSRDPVAVLTSDSANVRSGPSRRSNVVGSLTAGQELLADGLSQDGAWLRVVFNERIGWISRTVIEENAEIDELPVRDGLERAPMQSFYLRTGIGGVRCEAATDSVLVVQGPEDIEIDLTVNGARIRIGSTIIVRILPPGDLLEFIVIDGELIIFDDENGSQTVVPEGYRTTMCLDDGDDLGLDGNPDDLTVSCAPSTPEPLDTGDFGEFCTLQDFPVSLLNYGIDVQECGDDDVPISVITSEPNTPVVINPPQPTATTVNACAQFSLIDPLDGVPATPYTYRWSGYGGAEWYKVMFWDAPNNILAVEFRVDAPATSVFANIGQHPTGSAVQWEVLAMSGETILCSTGRSSVVPRIGDPNPPPPTTPEETEEPQEPETLAANWVCTTFSNGESPATATISWSGADSDVSIVYNVGEGTNSTTGGSPSGSTTVTLPFATSSGGMVSDADETVTLPALDCYDEPSPPGPLQASWQCTTLDDGETNAVATVSWSGADSDVTITYDNGEGNSTASGIGNPTGSTTITLFWSTPSGGTVGDADETVNLPALDCNAPPPPIGPLQASWECLTLSDGESPATVTVTWSGADSNVSIVYNVGEGSNSTSGGNPSGSTVVGLPFGVSSGGTVSDADEQVNLPALDCNEPPPPVGPLQASWECLTLFDGESPATATVTWSGADSDVTILYDIGDNVNSSVSGGNPSGSTTITLFYSTPQSGSVTDADETVNLGPLNCNAPPPPVGPLQASWECEVLFNGDNTATAIVSWSGADSDVSISYDAGEGNNTLTGEGNPSGSTTVDLFNSTPSGGTVSDADELVNLGSLDCNEEEPVGPLTATWECGRLSNGESPATAIISWDGADSDVTIVYENSGTPTTLSGGSPSGNVEVELTFGYSEGGGSVADSDEEVFFGGIGCYEDF